MRKYIRCTGTEPRKKFCKIKMHAVRGTFTVKVRKGWRDGDVCVCEHVCVCVLCVCVGGGGGGGGGGSSGCVLGKTHSSNFPSGFPSASHQPHQSTQLWLGTWHLLGCKFKAFSHETAMVQVGLRVPTPLAVRKGLFSCEFLAWLQELCLHGSQCLLSAQASWLCQVRMAASSSASRTCFCVCVWSSKEVQVRMEGIVQTWGRGDDGQTVSIIEGSDVWSTWKEV